MENGITRFPITRTLAMNLIRIVCVSSQMHLFKYDEKVVRMFWMLGRFELSTLQLTRSVNWIDGRYNETSFDGTQNGNRIFGNVWQAHGNRFTNL